MNLSYNSSKRFGFATILHKSTRPLMNAGTKNIVQHNMIVISNIALISFSLFFLFSFFIYFFLYFFYFLFLK